MKVRSKALYLYLLQADVLNGSEEDILRCKKAFRTAYKRQWKQRSRPKKEIRFTLTLREFELLKARTRMLELRHTAYVKSLVLSSIGRPALHDDRLLEVLQIVSMAVTGASRGMQREKLLELLYAAENKLFSYLNIEKYENGEEKEKG